MSSCEVELPWKLKRTPKGFWDLYANVNVSINHDSNTRQGTIIRVNGNGTYNVKYENCENEEKITKDRVKITWRPNVRKYADWLFNELGFDVKDKLYRINIDMIINNHGRSLLFTPLKI